MNTDKCHQRSYFSIHCMHGEWMLIFDKSGRPLLIWGGPRAENSRWDFSDFFPGQPADEFFLGSLLVNFFPSLDGL